MRGLVPQCFVQIFLRYRLAHNSIVRKGLLMILDTEKPISTKTLGQAIVDSKDFAQRFDRLMPGDSIRIPFERKDITGLSQLLPQPIGMVGGGWGKPLAIRGRLVPVGRTTAGAVSFPRENTPYGPGALFNAAIPEGTAKPENDSDDWRATTEIVKTFAAVLKISRQTLDDLPYLADRINQRMQTALAMAIDEECILGAGTATHLNGLYTQAATMAGTGTSASNSVGRAYSELVAKGYVPDGIVFHAADLGQYMTSGSLGLGIDVNLQSQPIWGMRVGVVSGATMSGNFLIGAFAGNCLLAEREAINVEIAYENVDDFV